MPGSNGRFKLIRVRGIENTSQAFRHNGEPGGTRINHPSYDHSRTRELVMLIKGQFPQARILFNDPLLVKDGLTKKFAEHDNHLHVHFG